MSSIVTSQNRERNHNELLTTKISRSGNSPINIRGFPILARCSLHAKANQNGIVITHANGNGFDILINSDSRQVEEALAQNQTPAGLRSYLAHRANRNITIVATDEA